MLELGAATAIGGSSLSDHIKKGVKDIYKKAYLGSTC